MAHFLLLFICRSRNGCALVGAEQVVVVGNEQCVGIFAKIGTHIVRHAESCPKQLTLAVMKCRFHADVFADASELKQPLIYAGCQGIGLSAEGFQGIVALW